MNRSVSILIVASIMAGCLTSNKLGDRKRVEDPLRLLGLNPGDYIGYRLSRDPLEYRIRDAVINIYEAAQTNPAKYSMVTVDTNTGLPHTYIEGMGLTESEFAKLQRDAANNTLDTIDRFCFEITEAKRKLKFKSKSSGMPLTTISINLENGRLRRDGQLYESSYTDDLEEAGQVFGSIAAGYQFLYRSPLGASLDDMQDGQKNHIIVNTIKIYKLQAANGHIVSMKLIDYNRGLRSTVRYSKYIRKYNVYNNGYTPTPANRQARLVP